MLGGERRRDAQLLKDDALGVRRATEGVSLVGVAKVSLGVVLVVPALDTTVAAQLARRSKSAGLAARRYENRPGTSRAAKEGELLQYIDVLTTPTKEGTEAKDQGNEKKTSASG